MYFWLQGAEVAPVRPVLAVGPGDPVEPVAPVRGVAPPPTLVHVGGTLDTAQFGRIPHE